jgi:hypothetical protein
MGIEQNRFEYTELSPAEVKAELMKPLTLEEVSPKLLHQARLRPEAKAPHTLLMERSAANFSVRVYKNHFGEFEGYEFQILEGDTHKIANLMFERRLGEAGPWDMVHRIVDTGELGISGTELLNWSEEYLKIANELRVSDIEQIAANSYQPKVTRWLIKNGYHFAQENDERIYQDYLDNPSGYELVKVDYGDEITERDLFLFKKHSGEDGKVETEDLETGVAEIKMTRRDLLAQPDLVALKLVKDL